jgi:YbgC/YbaW family acyl-CoA thioester hydrolase
MGAQFTTTRRVEFADTDAAGILHFASFYRYMEEAEHAFFRSLGLSVMLREPDGSALGWPRVNASCTFEVPAYFEDVLEIRMNVVRKGLKSLTMQFEIWRDETRIAHGSLTTVCCLCRPGLPLISVPIPPDIGDKIGVGLPDKP